MKTVSVQIKGTRPLFFHAFRVESITSLTKVKSGSAGNNPEEWKDTVHEKDGVLYLPGSYFGACLKEGSRHTKAGRGTIQKTFVSSMVVTTDEAFIDRKLPAGWREMTFAEMTHNSDSPVYLDIRGVMNPNSKGRNVRYRVACCPGWKTAFTFEFDENVVSPSQVKKIVEDSGKMAGVGDARALGYGRFMVEGLEIE